MCAYSNIISQLYSESGTMNSKINFKDFLVTVSITGQSVYKINVN